MSERVLVTGGAGFIGSHLVHRLAARGDEVRVLDDLSRGSRDNLRGAGAGVTLFEASVLDAEALSEAMAGCRYVLHQAARVSVPESLADPAETHAVNATGTLRVLEAARAAGVERVVQASSCAVYGNEPGLPKHEDDRLAPESPYAATKRLAELYGTVWTSCFGLEVVSLRYFNVFGSRQDPAGGYAAVVPMFARALLAGDTPRIFGDGGQTRDLVFVDDVVEANLRACTAPGAAGAVLNVGRGERVRVDELLELLAEAADVPAAPRYEPAREGEVRHSVADVSRARETLGWTPSVELRDGLVRTLEAYRAGRDAGEDA